MKNTNLGRKWPLLSENPGSGRLWAWHLSRFLAVRRSRDFREGPLLRPRASSWFPLLFAMLILGGIGQAIPGQDLGAEAAPQQPATTAAEAGPAPTSSPPGDAASSGPISVPAAPPAAGAARSVAADGTVSVVVPPPAVTGGPEAAVIDESPADRLLLRALEPMAEVQGQTNVDAASADVGLLYARPLSLLESLQRSGDPTRRLWITQAYWKVSSGYAALRLASEALDRLELVAPSSDPHDRVVLDVGLAAARAELADARAAVVATQQELVDLIRLPVNEPLPWPVDRPLTTAYETHFQAIFSTRLATGRIRAIDRMLPSKHEALESRAAAVLAAEQALAMAETDHARGKRPIEAVIAAAAAVRSQQREFLASLTAYNLDIAEYAMAVADLTLPDDRYVSMLIGTPIQWRQPPVAPPTTAGNAAASPP
jgi:hypothetical protein